MKKKIIFFILILVQWTFAQNMTLKDLNSLKTKNLITPAEYDIMVSELNKSLNPTKKLYTLFINDTLYDNLFPVMEYKNSEYINLSKFLELMEIKYSVKDSTLTYKLNYSLKLENNYSINLNDKDNIIIKDNDIYILENDFASKFCKKFNIKKDTIHIWLNFMSQQKLNECLNILAKRKNNEKKTFLYANRPEFINLGTVRPIVSKDLNNSNWDGDLKYYSDFLFGNLETNYNIKNKKLDDISLKYDYLLDKHEIKFYNKDYYFTKKCGFSIKKSNGYFFNDNNTYIKENVPRGSKVELLYLGKIIEVQSENNGKVYFYGPLIKRGHIYTLKIHTLSGEVYTKVINIADNYNLQKRNEYDYNMRFEKNIKNQKIYENFNFYYGLTDNLTLGIKNRYFKNNKYLGGNIIIGDNLSSTSYVVNFENLKNLNIKNSYSNVIEGKFNYKNIKNKFIFNDNHLDLKNLKRFKELETKYCFSATYDSSIGLAFKENDATKFFTPTYNINIPTQNFFFNISGDKNEIENTITTSYRSCFLTLTNGYNRKEKDFKSTLDITSISIVPFEYDFAISYSKQKKELFTFKFTLNYDSWLKFKSFFDSNSHKYNSSIMLDKYIDLKNLSFQSLNSVKIIPFLDKNKNGIKDKDEEIFNNTCVELNGQKKIILDNKPIYFSNIGMYIEYPMNITVRTYGYKVKHPKMNLVKTTNQIMSVYIPVEKID